MVQEKPGDQKPTVEQALKEVVAELIDEVKKLADRVAVVEKTAVKKSSGLFGGKRERTAIKDTVTGVIYPSKAAVGKAIAGEADADPGDHFAWYKLLSKFPDRFVAATQEEAEASWKKVDDERAKEVEESNRRIAAEEAAAAKAKK